MNYARADWTMVIAGSWNAGIFQPPWVSGHVFQAQQMNMEVQLGVVSPILRYNSGLSTLIVQPDMIVGGVREETQAAVAEVSQILCRILGELPHTPVTAIGINFGFHEGHPEGRLLENFSIADNQKIVDAGGTVRQTTILREITLDGGLLRLRETSEEDGSIHFHLNFHYDVTSAENAAAILQASAEPRRQCAIKLMRDVYGLEQEEVHVE